MRAERHFGCGVRSQWHVNIKGGVLSSVSHLESVQEFSCEDPVPLGTMEDAAQTVIWERKFAEIGPPILLSQKHFPATQ